MVWKLYLSLDLKFSEGLDSFQSFLQLLQYLPAIVQVWICHTLWHTRTLSVSEIYTSEYWRILGKENCTIFPA